MGKVIFAVICAAVLITALSYFQMYQHAERVNMRIEREALALFDRARGISSIENKVREILKDEKVDLVDNGLNLEIINSARTHAADMVGISRPNSGAKSVLVTTTFKTHRFVFSHTYTRKAKKDLYGQNDRAGDSQGRSSAPFGVNMGSQPSRDIGSHRKSIDKAVGGRMP